MRWRDKYRGYSRPARPKARRLTKEEQERLLKKFTAEVKQSPVLAALGCQVSAARGRFYVDRSGDAEQERWGRITPLDGSRQYLLERERRQNQWYEVAKGGPKKLINTIAGDTRGTFHGLGSVDAALRRAGGDSKRLEIQTVAHSTDDEERACPSFVYRSGRRRCTTQEVLHLYFGIPLHLLVQPRGWYIRHRQPYLVQHSADRSRVLVRFCSSSISGDPIVGTCLCLRHDEQLPEPTDEQADEPVWAAYTIRPNASESIEMAEAWIVKRKWRPW